MTLPSTASATPLRVLYITDSLDAPFRYRCENACLQLRRSGVRADIATVTHPDLLALLPDYPVIVLFRLAWCAVVARIADAATSLHATLVFDIDDLIFTRNATADLTFLRSAGTLQRAGYQVLSARLRETIMSCPNFIGSTPELVRAASNLGRNAFHHPNLLLPGTLRSARWIDPFRKWLQKRRILSYLSGSNTHDLDLESITQPLIDVLTAHPDVLLLLGGFVQMPEALEEFAPRVIRAPYVDWRVLPWLQAMACCNLAPLAESNSFSNAKSELKFFEAAIAGVPTISSPTKPMMAAISSGHDGFIASNRFEWRAAMEYCLDRANSARIGQAARLTALDRFTADTFSGALASFLGGLVDPMWRTPVRHRAAVPLHAGLCDVPGKTVTEMQGNGLKRLRDIWRILRSADEPRKLSAAVSYSQEPLRLCRWTLDPEPESHAANFRQSLPLAWRAAQQLSHSGLPQDQYRITGHDPFLLSEACTLDPSRVRALRIRMRVHSEEMATLGQLYWISNRHPHFSEHWSVSFPILADGRIHTYLLHLDSWEDGTKTPWGEAGSISLLRFDPLSCTGLIELGELTLGTMRPKLPLARPQFAAEIA